MALPFGRQTSREALEETTRSIKSSLTEGSSRIFGSVMGAKRGLIGGITSTFDQVVNIVGGSEDTSEGGGGAGGGSAEAQPPKDGGGGGGVIPPHPHPSQQQQHPVRPKPKPPKPPAPVTRQRSDVDVNGAVKQFDGGRVSRQNTVPVGGGGGGGGGGSGGAIPGTTNDCPPPPLSSSTMDPTCGPPDFADGKQRRKIDAKPPLKRRNTNPFMDDYDPSAVEPDYAAGGGGGGGPPPGAGGGTEVPQVLQDIGGCAGEDTVGGGCGVKVAPTQRYSEPSEAWNSRGGGDTSSGPRPLPPSAPTATSSDGGTVSSSLLPGIPTNVRGGRVDEEGRGGGGGCPASSVLYAPNRDLLAMTPTSGAGLPDPQIVPERRRQTTESDPDSEGTEGCDDELDEEDQLAAADDDPTDAPASGSAAAGGCGSGGGGGMMLKSGSRNSDQSWGCSGGADDEGMDSVSAECIEFMKYFVQKIFDPTSETTARDKAKFGELCQNGFGRLWFARCINSQRVNNKRVSEETFYALIQFFIIVLFECNEADDYGPAKTLMNMSFTFHCEGAGQGCSNGRSTKQFLYSFLKDQPIWQSPRFWNAAFFYAVQQERASKPLATSSERKEEKRDDRSFQENITFGQLGTFSSNMRAFGLTKEQCLEFIRKQATIANLPPGQVKLLRQSMERWTEESFQ